MIREVEAPPKRKADVAMQFSREVGSIGILARPSTVDREVMAAMDDTAVKRNLAALQGVREDNDRLGKRVLELENLVMDRENKVNLMAASISVSNNNHVATVRGLETNLANLSQENVRLRTLLESKSTALDQASSEMARSRTLMRSDSTRSLESSEREREVTELRLYKHVTRQELETLRSELEEARHKLELFRNEQQYEKIHLSSQDRVTRNNYEVTIHNLTSELESAKIKLEGVQVRLEMKNKELKDKDDFIRNTIVSRVGREANESEVDYFTRKMDQFMDTSRQRVQN